MARPKGRRGRRWFVVHCRTSQERGAAERLAAQGFGPFLPMIETEAGGEEPLFPGYLFVRFDPDRKSGRPIRSTRGVIRLVSFGEGQAPSAVPDGLVEELQRRSAGGAIGLERPVYARGQSVRLAEGPFAGLVAEVLEQDSSGRLSLLFEAMGRVNRFRVPCEAVERI